MSQTPEQELQAIRMAVAEVMGGEAEVPPEMSTLAVVGSLLGVAMRQHEQLQSVITTLRGVGAATAEGEAPATLDVLVAQVVQEIESWRASAEDGSLRVAEVSAEDAKAIFTQAIEQGKVQLSPAATAGLREALTGESGAVEVSLTEHEVTDLVLSGVAFTEVGGPDGTPEVLVKLVDTTGLLRTLAPLVRKDDQGHVTH